MANKKRRKPQNRPRQQPARATVTTAERTESGNGARGDTSAPARTRPAERTRPSAAEPSRSVRAEKKELARQQREEVRRRVRRQQRVRQGVRVGAVVVVVGLAAFWFLRPDGPPASTSQLPGLLRTQAPWDANADQAAERADAIQLPRHGTTLAMHEHANLQVFVHGVQQQVPVDIGIDGRDIASLHTHSPDGLVHVESSTVAEFTLKQFLDVWGVRFTDTCLGAYCDDAQNRLQLWVNGTEFTGDPTDVPLDNETVIVITYGTPDELPDPIPSSFDFVNIVA